MMFTETEEVPELIRPFLNPFKMSEKKEGSQKKCVLMFTPPMEKGTCILGMPFMRNYYTTFDRVGRTVSTALHDGSCNMDVPHEGLKLRQKWEESKMQLRRIDVSKLQFSDGFMSLWNKHQAAEKALEQAVDNAAAAVGIAQKKDGLLLREKVK